MLSVMPIKILKEYSKAKFLVYNVCLVTQSCLTLCNPRDCSPPGSSVHGDFPGKNTGAGCHALLQGIFLTQGSNPGIPHYRQILYCLSHLGSPKAGWEVLNSFSFCLSVKLLISPLNLNYLIVCIE